MSIFTVNVDFLEFAKAKKKIIERPVTSLTAIIESIEKGLPNFAAAAMLTTVTFWDV